MTAARIAHAEWDEVMGMIVDPRGDSRILGVARARREPRDGPGAQPPVSHETCSSCGARIGREVSSCSWCGRIVLRDAVFAPDAE